jgi:hypothetical protein
VFLIIPLSLSFFNKYIYSLLRWKFLLCTYKEKQPHQLFFKNQSNSNMVFHIQGNHILAGHKQDSHNMVEDIHRMDEDKSMRFLIARLLTRLKMAAQSQ